MKSASGENFALDPLRNSWWNIKNKSKARMKKNKALWPNNTEENLKEFWWVKNGIWFDNCSNKIWEQDYSISGKTRLWSNSKEQRRRAELWNLPLKLMSHMMFLIVLRATWWNFGSTYIHTYIYKRKVKYFKEPAFVNARWFYKICLPTKTTHGQVQ